MARRNWIVFSIIVIIFAAALWVLLPIDSERFGRQGMRLGLDLVGGSHLVYQAQFPEGATADDKAKNLDRALITIQNRIDKYGVTEPVIQKQEGDRILVQLPGFTDIEAAKELVEQTGFLEFRMVEVNEDGEPVSLNDYVEREQKSFFDENVTGDRIFLDGEGNPIAFLDKDDAGSLSFTDEAGNLIEVDQLKGMEEKLLERGMSLEGILSWVPARGDDGTQLTGGFLKTALPDIQERPGSIEAQVDIEWNDEGGEIFDQIARRIYDSGVYGTPQRAIGIFLDKSLISAPQILEPAYGGKGSITGDFTIEEVQNLSNLLESGALPMPLQKPPLYEEKVSATLGADFISMSVRAGLIGILLVMLFMCVYYRLSGVLASLSLVFYGTLVLAVFKLWPVTLTLAGLGGFVLSIGMAVDANVLIFERMKEEFRSGRMLGAAIEAGFGRAWPAIRDSNVTTIIVCVILIWLAGSIVASAPVMGFAWALLIGVLVSMFTAIVVTKTFLRLFVGTALARKPSLFSPYSGRK
ncbi:protein translocase subunit SecD [Bacteroidota bacterium]